MNVSLNWLKEYVNLDENIDIKEIVDRLTMTGTKVEKYERYGIPVTNVYTAKVENITTIDKDTNKVILDMGDRKYTAIAKIPDIQVRRYSSSSTSRCKDFK